MRGLHLGTRPTSTTPGTGASGRVTFIVVDDVVYLTDPVTGYVYEAPVTFVGPTTLPSGLITADADTLFFHYAGGTWSSPATQVEGAAPVGGTILNDTFYVTIASVTYALPVTATGDIPGMPPGGETSLVVIDGVEYLRIVFPDGEVRYEEVHETPTPDAEGGGGGGSDFVNVASFGAVGDGVADDSEAVQAAIDSLSTTGGIVFVPVGTYKFTAPLLLRQGIHLKGESQAATVLRWNLSGVSLLRSASKGVAAIYHVAVEDLTVDNTTKANAGAVGIDFQDIAISTITSVCVTNVALGVQFASTMPANLNCYYNIMTHADIIECTRAIAFREAANEIKVFGGRIDTSGTPEVGIDLQACSNVEIHGIASGHYTPIINVGPMCRGTKLMNLYMENAITSGVAIKVEAGNEDTAIIFPHFALVGAGFTNIQDLGNTTTVLHGSAGSKFPSVQLATVTGTPAFSGTATFNGAAVFNGDLTSTAGTVQFTRPSSGTALTVNNPSTGRAAHFINNSAAETVVIQSSVGGIALEAVNGKVIVPDDPYNATSWDGNLSVPTKNAVRDALASLGSGGGVALGDSPTWTGKHIFGVAGAASAPAVSLTGVPYVGGTATTTKPLFLIEPLGSTSTGWSTLGTLLGVNAPAGFTGNLIDAQLNGVSKFKVGSDGAVTLTDHLMMTAGRTLFCTGIYSSGALTVSHANGDDVRISSSTLNTPLIGFYGVSAAYQTSLGTIGVANLRQGKGPSATPLAQTFTLGEASRPGTDSNVAGANGTIQSGLGTGTGTASSLIFQTPTVAGAGSGVQTYGTRLTINANGLNFPTAIATGWIQGTTIYVGVTGTTALKSTVDGILGLYNSAENNFSRLQLGGTTASFPAIKRNAASIDFRLADDTGYCAIGTGALTAWSGNIQTAAGYVIVPDTLGLSWASRSYVASPGIGIIKLSNGAETDFNRLQLGGTTASFPAIKRNGAGIDFRLADDSGYTSITAQNVYSVATAFFPTVGNAGAGFISFTSDGVITLRDNGFTSFDRLQLGGTTASFPAIKRSGAIIHCRLADDSNYCDIVASGVSVSDGSFLMKAVGTLVNGAAAATGTLTNAPVAGNPTKWIKIYDNGTTRHIPAW